MLAEFCADIWPAHVGACGVQPGAPRGYVFAEERSVQLKIKKRARALLKLACLSCHVALVHGNLHVATPALCFIWSLAGRTPCSACRQVLCVSSTRFQRQDVQRKSHQCVFGKTITQ